MTNKGLLILVVGLSMLAGGLFALWWPVFLDAYDQWGFQIQCGNGFDSDTTKAAAADSVRVDECNSALAVRRGWAIPAVIVGTAILAWVLVELWRHSARHTE